MTNISRTVLVLGIVSLLTDLSSEMIYPLLPVFLSTVLGAGAIALGTMEGAAEALASVLKMFSGAWSDRLGKRKPLIMAGYGLAGFVRPFIALAGSWPVVLMIRLLDRVGKGLRTSPRDALIADATVPASRGTAYGFHRAMDHAGAVLGPLVAGLLLSIGIGIREVFWWAAVPALLAFLVLLAGLREPPRQLGPASSARPESRSALNSGLHWSETGQDFKKFLLAVLVFTLGNSTDAFFLMRLSNAGISAGSIAVLWSLHHVVKMVSTYFGGRYADRWGHRKLILAGWIYYGVIYLAFALVQSEAALIAVFLAYGIYFGLTEPAEKALVSQLVSKNIRGSSFGFYHLVIGIGALPASFLFGSIWQTWNYQAAFITGAALAFCAGLLLLRVPGKVVNQ
ncbi:MAG TPA: MFS transporter [Bdellovibrionota bacterium]|nr:MFS transporter [Bdellovibrionota bacterium]